MRLHASLCVHCCATGWGCMCVRACGCTQGWGHTRVCAVGKQTAVVPQGEPHCLFAAPGSASPPFFASWSPFPSLALLWGCPLHSQLSAGPFRPLIVQRQFRPAPDCFSQVSGSFISIQPLIGQRQLGPALTGLSLVRGSSGPSLASHWLAASPSRTQWPLIGQRQLQPAPGGLSLLSGCSIPPPVASHWSVAAPACPL